MLAIHNICRNVIKYVFSLGYYDFYRHHEDVTLNNNNNNNNSNNNNRIFPQDNPSVQSTVINGVLPRSKN